jgi:hypothetical protein
MREKYIEEQFPSYMVFGEHRDGYVDVASSQGDIVTHILKKEAEQLIYERRVLLNKLIKVSLAFAEINHEEFTKIWYDNK